MSGERAQELIARRETLTADATQYAFEHLDDPPEISKWVWTEPKR
jgi:hypothetical protein